MLPPLESLLRLLRLRRFGPRYLDPSRADAWGVVAVGGDLRPEWLLHAYRNAIFPWYDENEPVHWWSPDPRGIIELDGLHVSRRLQRTLRSGRFSVTVSTPSSSSVTTLSLMVLSFVPLVKRPHAPASA